MVLGRDGEGILVMSDAEGGLDVLEVSRGS
jgi:hypothetical protein